MATLNQTKNRRILVIDDNRSIHDDIRTILGGDHDDDTDLETLKNEFFDEKTTRAHRPDYIIDSAYQGEEGLAKVQNAIETDQPYAMAFVDIRMPPGWDGIETIPHLWKAEPNLGRGICTAYSDYD